MQSCAVEVCECDWSCQLEQAGGEGNLRSHLVLWFTGREEGGREEGGREGGGRKGEEGRREGAREGREGRRRDNCAYTIFPRLNAALK